MSNYSKIEWCDSTWNIVTGCTKVSEGCRNCYAETIAKRFWGERKFTDVQTHPDRLDAPLHWKKPRRVFVNSMSDLFHKDVSFEFILRMWMTMAAAHEHTFMILTKRPDRMSRFVNEWLPGAWGLATMSLKLLDRPIPNIWLGVSAENQRAMDERASLLLGTPAAVRFVSIEPMLSAVNVKPYLYGWHSDPRPVEKDPGIDWMICGGETGPNARPMRPDWARSLRDQCIAAGVPFFFKSWGEWGPAEKGRLYDIEKTRSIMWIDGQDMLKIGKKAAGRLLDGVEWNEYPEAKS